MRIGSQHTSTPRPDNAPMVSGVSADPRCPPDHWPTPPASTYATSTSTNSGYCQPLSSKSVIWWSRTAVSSATTATTPRPASAPRAIAAQSGPERSRASVVVASDSETRSVPSIPSIPPWCRVRRSRGGWRDGGRCSAALVHQLLGGGGGAVVQGGPHPSSVADEDPRREREVHETDSDALPRAELLRQHRAEHELRDEQAEQR